MSTRLLSRTEAFKGLTNAELAILEKTAGALAYSKNEIVFKEGDKSDNMFLVAEGAVEIRKGGGDRAEGTLLAQLKVGDLFGEMAVFDNEPRSASAVAVGDKATKILIWRESDLRQIVKDYPTLGTKILVNIIRGLSSNLRRANDVILKFRIPVPNPPPSP